MQLRASRSGASSGSGKDGWLRRTQRREVTARMSVSKLARLLSRVRRMSAGEKSEKTSSVDSGSSQNCACYVSRALALVQDKAGLTPVQYSSSAAICLGSERRKMPCLKLSLESEAPIGMHAPCYVCIVVRFEKRLIDRSASGKP